MEIEQFWIGFKTRIALPDVNTESPEVVITLYKWIREIVKKYSIDGIRIDTAKHVRKSFWPGFVKASGVFAMGEVLDGDPKLAPNFQKTAC
jgi:alpha-amylase